MTNGLTQNGTCRPSCFHNAGNGCCHPQYTKTQRDGLQCPEDPRTKEQIAKDVLERKQYFKNRTTLIAIKYDLKTLNMSKTERNKKIKELTKMKKEVELLIKTHESNYKY